MTLRREYPDYYDEIQTPISMYLINQKLKNGHYNSVQMLLDDLNTMFDNAQDYNADGSEIFKVKRFVN